jgi:hypothetical protein
MKIRFQRVEALLSALGIALGALPGVAAATAPASTAVSGQVYPVDGGPVTELGVWVRAGAWADSAAVDASGTFAVSLPRDLAGAILEVSIDVRGGAQRRYLPALFRLTSRDVQRWQEVILVPLRWHIAAGRYAGVPVDISLHRAFQPPCHGCPAFFRLGATVGVAEPLGGLPVWPDERFPLRVAFDRERSDERVTARDSAAFWRIADAMEHAFGRQFFRPVLYEDVRRVDDDTPADVVLVWIVSSLRDPGRGAIGFYRDRIISGAVSLRSTGVIHAADGPSIVTHELLHTLGFGHTCSWRSVLADVARCPSMRTPAPTPADVAYTELAYRVSTLARSQGIARGIEAALAGERAFILGLPVE